MTKIVSAVVLTLLLVVAACSDDNGSITTTTAASTPTTVIGPEGYSITDVADRLEARLELVSPDWLVADGDSLWVKRDDGGVERVDPETSEVVHTIVNEGAHCAGLGI